MTRAAHVRVWAELLLATAPSSPGRAAHVRVWAERWRSAPAASEGKR